MPNRKYLLKDENGKVVLAYTHSADAHELLKNLYHEHSCLGKAIEALEAVQRIRACRSRRSATTDVLRMSGAC
jgi:hypothetical protein